MPETRDYSHRTVAQKLGIKPDQRVVISGDVGSELRREVIAALGRGVARSHQLDGAIVLISSIAEAERCLDSYRPRLDDAGYLWIITRKRGHDDYVNQMALVPEARRRGLIDNKTCSVDESRSGIRFVVPRAERRSAPAR